MVSHTREYLLMLEYVQRYSSILTPINRISAYLALVLLVLVLIGGIVEDAAFGVIGLIIMLVPSYFLWYMTSIVDVRRTGSTLKLWRWRKNATVDLHDVKSINKKLILFYTIEFRKPNEFGNSVVFYPGIIDLLFSLLYIDNSITELRREVGSINK